MRIPTLEKAAVGLPITRMGVAFMPLYLPANELPNITTGPKTGLKIDELNQASVPTLVAHNPTESPILIVEGEHLIGGKQNRMLNATVLVPANAELEIPVSCLERGRWGRRHSYKRSTSFAPRRVRRRTQASVNMNVRLRNSRISDQGEVWSAVDRVLSSDNVSSRTSAAEDLHNRYSRDHDWTRAIEGLCALGPLPGQCGFAVGHGYKIVAVELFGSHGLLKQHWSALVRSYLLERIEPTGKTSTTQVLRTLHKFSTQVAKPTPGVGLGMEKRFEGKDITGQALVLDNQLVHATMFRQSKRPSKRR